MNTHRQVQGRIPSKNSGSSARSGVLQRKCACGGSPGPVGACANCRRKRGPDQAERGQPLQAKLRINQPGDRYEQEADRVAGLVMRMPEPRQFGYHMSADHVIEAGNGKSVMQTKPLVQRQSNAGAAANAAPGNAPPIVQEALLAPGRPLEPAPREFMEARIGHDFSQVRIHTGGMAARSAQSVNALAYTVGPNVVFAANQYRPDSVAGRSLLAHELTHVIQQASSLSGPIPTLQRVCQDESFYQSSPDYCRDDTFSPSTHPGKTCYRQIPTRESYFSCPPGEHVCFDADGTCEDSPDRSSLAEGTEDDGSCNWNGFCVAEHTAVDFVPAVAESAVEPFAEFGREVFNPANWYRWAGVDYPF